MTRIESLKEMAIACGMVAAPVVLLLLAATERPITICRDATGQRFTYSNGGLYDAEGFRLHYKPRNLACRATPPGKEWVTPWGGIAW